MLASAWRTTVVAALAVATLGLTTTAPATATPVVPGRPATSVIEAYRERIPALLAQEHVPGLAVVVVDGDRVLWQEGFGVTDEGGPPVTVDTVFGAQSTSKTFTATAVLLAVQAGMLDLDVPITTYLPDFTVHSAFEEHPERRITVRMLLSHTAGFTHEAPIGNNYGVDPGDFETHVRSISATWLRFPVGTGYAYSNLGIDLAGHVLEVVVGRPFATVVRDTLLAPLGMEDSTFDRARVAATRGRAAGHSGLVRPPLQSPMTAAGGLWTSARDLGTFLRFQLGNGSLAGHQVMTPALMEEMRTVPAPSAGAPAGYALGVARTRWRAGRYLDLFSHGGGGNGFLTDLWWLPQLQLGIGVLTNSSDHDLQGTLALQILQDLATHPDSPYHDRLLALPEQSDVVEPDGHYVPPPDLGERIAALAAPTQPDSLERWNAYPQWYRVAALGGSNPAAPPSRFHVDAGVAYFDAAEDGTAVRHRLVEYRPGVFLADDGETLDLRGPTPAWRGLHLRAVTDGPLPVQWALLGAVALVAAGWLLIALVGGVVHRRRRSPHDARRAGRRVTTTVAALGAVTAICVAGALRVLPGLVDVGFLGGLPFPLPLRLLLHLPLAVTVLAVALVALLVAGAVRRWWDRPVRPTDAALALAMTALAVQLTSWQLVQLAV
jgi:CubicO group peptidase (beta-lactamase class C family)